MAQTFAYDLVSFLRVLYRRRTMIITGTICVTVLVALATLIWPQTWRADARVLVSTPKYKESLRLVSKPFDVLTYQGVMLSDRIYQQIIASLKWYRLAVHQLYDDPEFLTAIDKHLGEKSQKMTIYEKIQNTNLTILTGFLVPQDEKDDPQWAVKINMLGHLSAEELETAYKSDPDELDDLTVFDLRKMLSASVSKVRETNMEVEYSRVIRVSAEFDTASSAKMLANTWLDLFLARSEEIVRGAIENEITRTQDRAKGIEIDLVKAEKALADYEKESKLQQARAELASKLVQLTGMAPNRRIADSKEESFSLDDEDESFMKERREIADSLSFSISSQYQDAFLPTQQKIEGEVFLLNAFLKSMTDNKEKQYQELLKQKNELDAKLLSVKDQVKRITREISTLSESIRNHETAIEQLRRNMNQHRSALTAIRPLLDEAALLQSRGENIRYSDVSVDRAIKPDKRVSPKRSYMTAAGMLISFFLWCFMAFFLDIWYEVIKPDDQENGIQHNTGQQDSDQPDQDNSDRSPAVCGQDM